MAATTPAIDALPSCDAISKAPAQRAIAVAISSQWHEPEDFGGAAFSPESEDQLTFTGRCCKDRPRPILVLLRGHIATQQSRLLACDPPKRNGQQLATLASGRTRPALLELTFDQDGHVLE